MARLLVTGGAGFIGSSFTRMAVTRGYDVRVLDTLTYAGNRENLWDPLTGRKIEFLKADVCDAQAMKGCDAVAHLAAETHADRSVLEAGTFVRTDVYRTYVLLEAARWENVDRLLHVSTDEVHEGERAVPVALGNPFIDCSISAIQWWRAPTFGPIYSEGGSRP